MCLQFNTIHHISILKLFRCFGVVSRSPFSQHQPGTFDDPTPTGWLWTGNTRAIRQRCSHIPSMTCTVMAPCPAVALFLHTHPRRPPVLRTESGGRFCFPVFSHFLSVSFTFFSYGENPVILSTFFLNKISFCKFANRNLHRTPISIVWIFILRRTVRIIASLTDWPTATGQCQTTAWSKQAERNVGMWSQRSQIA